jgi:hypothetical protein
MVVSGALTKFLISMNFKNGNLRGYFMQYFMKFSIEIFNEIFQENPGCVPGRWSHSVPSPIQRYPHVFELQVLRQKRTHGVSKHPRPLHDALRHRVDARNEVLNVWPPSCAEDRQVDRVRSNGCPTDAAISDLVGIASIPLHREVVQPNNSYASGNRTVKL